VCAIIIEKDGVRYAEYLPATSRPSVGGFFSERNAGFQFGVMIHPEGHRERAHYHSKIAVGESHLSEFIFIQKGVMTISFYLSNGIEFNRIKLSVGDAIVLIDGIHSYIVNSDLQAIIIKQGPFRDGVEKMLVDF